LDYSILIRFHNKIIQDLSFDSKVVKIIE